MQKLCHSSLHRYSNTHSRHSTSRASFATVHFTGTATRRAIKDSASEALPQFTSQVQQHLTAYGFFGGDSFATVHFTGTATLNPKHAWQVVSFATVHFTGTATRLLWHS